MFYGYRRVLFSIVGWYVFLQTTCHAQMQQNMPPQPTGNFGTAGYPATTTPANYSVAAQRSGPTEATDSSAFEYRSGLLGKTVLRGSYVSFGVDTPQLAVFDDAFQGFDVELSTPLPWLTTDVGGVDIFADYDSVQLTGSTAIATVDAGVNFFTIGTRIYREYGERFRPFISLGARQTVAELEIKNSGGLLMLDTVDRDWTFYSGAGLEFDVAERLALRVDVDLLPERFEDGFLEGTMLFWNPQKTFFVRGGVRVPFESELATGGVIGAGVAF